MWKEIWENKGEKWGHVSRLSLQTLITIDGFDSGAGKFSLEDWKTYARYITSRMDIKARESVLEVGCGAGALLKALPIPDTKITGCDYSKHMIHLARRVFPRSRFIVCEANEVASHFPSHSFDAIVINSVFQYFDSIGYAKEVIYSCSTLLKRGGMLAILDLSDLSRREESISARKKEIGARKYEQMYKDLGYLFLGKNWCKKIIKDELRFTDLLIENQPVMGYKNSRFRFNVFAEK